MDDRAHNNRGDNIVLPRNATLTDVATAAGVSLAAASRALNGKEGVRAPIRARVQIVADSLGYRPNRAAKNLAGAGASVMGVLLGVNELQRDFYGASVLQAIATRAAVRDEALMVIADKSGPSDPVQNLIRDGLIGGVIVSAVAIGANWVEDLLDAKVPTVLLGGHPRRSDVCVIDTENRKSSEAVVGRMFDTGCRRVATITGRMHRVDATRRLDGYRNAHTARGLDVDENLVFNGDFSRSTGWDLAEQIVTAGADGVFCANDQMALGLYEALMSRGIGVPDEISIAGFDGTSHLEFRGPEITSVAQPFEELADLAISALKSLVLREPVDLEQLVTPELIWGETTRALASN